MPAQQLLPIAQGYEHHGAIPDHWHHLSLTIAPCNRQAFNILADPNLWQEGALSLMGDRGAGKSFVAWYFFIKNHKSKDKPLPDLFKVAWRGLYVGGGQEGVGEENDKNGAMDWCRDERLTPHHILIWDRADEALSVLTPEQQMTLCYFFNRPKENRPKLLLLHRAGLTDSPHLLPDLVSRLATIGQVSLVADEASLKAQAWGFFAERQVAIQEKTINQIITHSARQHKALAQLLEGLDEESMRQQKPITAAMVRHWLEQELGEEAW